MEINKNTLKNYQFIVNYEKANLLHDELLNLIDKNESYLGFNKNFKESGMKILKYGGKYRDIIDSSKSYMLKTTIVNKSLDLFEQTGKAILINNNQGWKKCKELGHNIVNIYNELPSLEKSQFISAINDFYPITNNQEIVSILSNYTYTRDEAGNISRTLANIATRYPDEKVSKYDELFIAKASSSLFKIYKNSMPKEISYIYAREDDISYNDYQPLFLKCPGCHR
jgi:hypothetical protein